MKHFFSIFLLTFLSSSIFAQVKDSVICPKLTIIAPSDNRVILNGKHKFALIISDVENDVVKKLKYQWTVENGTMNDNGTRQLVFVRPTGNIGQRIIVEVKVIGLAPSCKSTTSVESDIVNYQFKREDTKFNGYQ